VIDSHREHLKVKCEIVQFLAVMESDKLASKTAKQITLRLQVNTPLHVYTTRHVIINTGGRGGEPYLWPLREAWCRGVYPVLSVQFTFRPFHMLQGEQGHIRTTPLRTHTHTHNLKNDDFFGDN